MSAPQLEITTVVVTDPFPGFIHESKVMLLCYPTLCMDLCPKGPCGVHPSRNRKCGMEKELAQGYVTHTGLQE